MKLVLNPEWLVPCEMERIIVHWTAGSYDISENDLAHYHFLVDRNGVGHLGDNPVSGNAANPEGEVTSHTKNKNTGSIGIAVAAMGNAVENPFNPGPWPITQTQWEALCEALAQLCDAYLIPVMPETVLMHGEVQETLGVKQDGKWDIGRLPFALEYKNSAEVGDLMREMVATILDMGSGAEEEHLPKPVTVSIQVESDGPVRLIVNGVEIGA